MSGAVEAGRGLRLRQVLVIALLFAGYSACYFCRADLAVAAPLITDDLVLHGSTHAQALVTIGQIASLGVLAYALGKLFLAGLGDVWGGRLSFLFGLGGATAFTFLFIAGGAVPIFTLAWIGNRLTQSMAWAGLIKVASRWFDFSTHGSVIGVLSISYLVGDAVARRWMASLLAAGYGWHSLFVLAGLVAGACFLANLTLLRGSREEAGHTPARTNPGNVYGGSADRPRNVVELVRPLIASRAFQVVCVLSLGCTIVRETFNLWTPMYLRDHLAYTVQEAAGASAVFPAVGAVSVLVAGWASDRLGVGSRAALLGVGLVLATLALVVLMNTSVGGNRTWAVGAIAVTAFCLLGPYSYLGGAMALDFGGKHGGAVSSGIIDGVGYLGSVVAGVTVAHISNVFGWKGVFFALAAVCAAAAAGAAYLYLLSVRSSAQE